MSVFVEDWDSSAYAYTPTHHYHTTTLHPVTMRIKKRIVWELLRGLSGLWLHICWKKIGANCKSHFLGWCKNEECFADFGNTPHVTWCMWGIVWEVMWWGDIATTTYHARLLRQSRITQEWTSPQQQPRRYARKYIQRINNNYYCECTTFQHLHYNIISRTPYSTNELAHNSNHTGCIITE